MALSSFAMHSFQYQTFLGNIVMISITQPVLLCPYFYIINKGYFFFFVSLCWFNKIIYTAARPPPPLCCTAPSMLVSAYLHRLCCVNTTQPGQLALTYIVLRKYNIVSVQTWHEYCISTTIALCCINTTQSDLLHKHNTTWAVSLIQHNTE